MPFLKYYSLRDHWFYNREGEMSGLTFLEANFR